MGDQEVRLSPAFDEEQVAEQPGVAVHVMASIWRDCEETQAKASCVMRANLPHRGAAPVLRWTGRVSSTGSVTMAETCPDLLALISRQKFHTPCTARSSHTQITG